jgi:AraC family transcriptional regulator
VAAKLSPDVFAPGTFTGETVSWSISDALLSEVRHHHGKDVPNHIHEAGYFSVLLEGSYFETAPDFTIAYEPYSLVFHAAGTEHSDTIGPRGCRMFFVEMLAPWTDVIKQLGKPPIQLFELHGGEPLWLVLRLHREFLFRDPEAGTTIESLLHELCCHAALVTEDDASEPAWIASVEDLLRSRFRSHPMITEIADQIGVHPGHLCKAFRRFRGRSLGDCIRGLRVQFVCRRLIESKDPLDEIALEAGFTDQSHMTRIFKRLTGYSPGSYRRRLH